MGLSEAFADPLTGPLFNHMGKVVVRSITSVPKENDFVVFRDICRINHGTKSRILISLSGRLD